MAVSANSGEYRSCPFCAELIRQKAIRCKHCNSALDPKKVRRYNRLRAANGWHLMLALLMFVVVFSGVYPRVVRFIQQVERADRSADARANRAQESVTDAATPTMTVSRLPLGTEELVAGQAYNGGQLLDLIESNFTESEIDPEKSITVSTGEWDYVIRTRKTEFSRSASYEIVGIDVFRK